MSSATTTEISLDLLQQQDAATSSAIIDWLAEDAEFAKLAQYEGDLTVGRDREDDEKLERGIDFAKAKGVIDPQFQPEPYVEIDVLGKSPAQVADLILATVDQQQQQLVKVNNNGGGNSANGTKPESATCFKILCNEFAL